MENLSQGKEADIINIGLSVIVKVGKIKVVMFGNHRIMAALMRRIGMSNIQMAHIRLYILLNRGLYEI
jgi:hypothetical protein